MGQSPRQFPQEAASPFLARWHSGDTPALGGSQSFPAFTPDLRVPLPRSLPALELEAEPRSLRVRGRGSKNWGMGKRELGVGGGLGGWQALVGSRWAGDTRRHTEGRAQDWHLSLSGMLRAGPSWGLSYPVCIRGKPVS